jgi:HK97 family phage major capsid protein
VSTEAPSIEYIRHTSTTGTPALVAEGAEKPELVMNTDKVVLPMEKVAAHVGIGWESISDFPAFLTYTTSELFREIVNVENLELLSGDGTAGHLTGILHTSGILAHATGSATALDSIESSIALLRNGPALAETNLAVISPTTWSAIRQSKDDQHRYLVTPNPLADTAKSIWGVEVLVTTQIADGTAALIDTSKIGRVYVREPLRLTMGWANDDFTRNVTRFIGEGRLNVAVERPAAVCTVTGLPTA